MKNFFILTVFLWINGCFLLSGCSEKPDIKKELSRDCYSHYQAKSYLVALSSCQKAANLGNAGAMWLVGNIYYFDLAKQGKDKDKGFNWYTKAAEANLVKAQSWVGEAYLYGRGVKEDFDKAYYWLKKAADKQDIQAEFSLGMIFYEGYGRDKDISSAISWFKKSAASQHFMSMNNLAWIYATSHSKSFRRAEKAVYWAEKIALESLPKEELDDSHIYLDTQAAAYALAGKFELAIDLQEQAIVKLSEMIDFEAVDSGKIDSEKTDLEKINVEEIKAKKKEKEEAGKLIQAEFKQHLLAYQKGKAWIEEG